MPFNAADGETNYVTVHGPINASVIDITDTGAPLSENARMRSGPEGLPGWDAGLETLGSRPGSAPMRSRPWGGLPLPPAAERAAGGRHPNRAAPEGSWNVYLSTLLAQQIVDDRLLIANNERRGQSKPHVTLDRTNGLAHRRRRALVRASVLRLPVRDGAGRRLRS